MSRTLNNRGGYKSNYTSSWKPNANVNVSKWRLPGNTGVSLGDLGYPSSYDRSQYKGSSGFTGGKDITGGLGGSKRGGGYGAGASLKATFKSNPWDDYLSKRQGMLQSAYDNSMGALNDAYGAYMAAMQENLDSARGALSDAYDRSKKSIADDATASLKQAYINKMLSEKNFDQQMSAQGLTGGASETTRAAMSNNYGNARNDINAQKAKNLSDLEGQYNQNIAQALQAYNSAVAQAELQKAMQQMELENMLMGGQIDALDAYYSNIGDFGDTYDADFAALGSGLNDFSFTPTSAKNTVATPNIVQSEFNGAENQKSMSNLLEALKALTNKANGTGMPTGINPQYMNALKALSLDEINRMLGRVGR